MQTMNTGHLIATASVLVGVTLVALQLLWRRWNMRKMTEEVANRFIDPAMYQHWLNVQTGVIDQRKKWNDISESQQHSVRFLMSYFETLGVLLHRRVIDRQLLEDLFGDIVVLLYECTKDYLTQLRELRQNQEAYAKFEYLATR